MGWWTIFINKTVILLQAIRHQWRHKVCFVLDFLKADAGTSYIHIHKTRYNNYSKL